jgi:23S rRNA pseudouridine955/2504/2580 synthase
MKKTKLSDILLYADDDFLLVNKPSGVSTLEDRNDPENMLAWLRSEYPDAQAAHRLDKETTGVLAFARHPEAYRHLAMQFEARTVKKVYHAISDGLHEFKEERILLPILPLSNGTVRISRAEGKPAETLVSTLQAFRQHSLLECRPVTGRMHQIRIHLSAMGAPITGDETYGGEPLLLSKLKRNFNLKKDEEELPLIQRVALHAFSLSFQSLKNTLVQVEAPYPKDMRAALRQLERFA